MLYSLGGVAGNFSQNSIWDASIAYSNGPISLGAGYTFVKDPYYSFFGNQGNSSTPSTAASSSANDNMNNKIFGGYASAGSQQIIVAGGSYATRTGNHRPAVLEHAIPEPGFGHRRRCDRRLRSTQGGTATFNSGEINLKYQVNPALLLAGAYIYTHNSGADNVGSAKYNQFNLGAIYSLSKRTSLYAIGFYETASGIDSTGKAAVADLNSSAYSADNHQLAGIFGITHKF